MENQYNIFLMIELAKVNSIISPDLEYDLQWARGQSLYVEFKNSSYNLFDAPEYDCINNFLQNEIDGFELKVFELSKEEELELNVKALRASDDGHRHLANSIWDYIEKVGYKRLDDEMSYREMLCKLYNGDFK
jgi:hypothetical protein